MIIYIFFSFILSYFLFSISKEDIKTMVISETKLRFFAVFGLLYLVCLVFFNERINGIELIKNNLFAMFIILIIMYIISYTSYKLLGINSLGLGDIKLSAISSIWLGIELSFISLIISFCLSAIYSLYGKIANKLNTFDQYPFAPFLSIGIFCSWILDKI